MFNNNNYGYMPPQMPMQSPRNEYAFVDGLEAAKAYRVPFGTMMLLMDSNAPICYKKQVDLYGRTITFEIYDLIPHEEKPPVEYVTKADFEAFKASLLPKEE